jgi:3-O-alpha-D-mannopyranosyl-alpha-D-mannopyranose xylosylphosphotransferase
MTRSVAHEASIMFSRQLALASTRGFRESKRGRADVHFAWLATHLHIERWREALLWSWAVARLGGEDGLWGDSAREELWDALNLQGITELTGEVPRDVVIVQGVRNILEDMDGMMEKNDWQFPEASEYLFSQYHHHLYSTQS